MTFSMFSSETMQRFSHILVLGKPNPQFLVQWEHQPRSEATREDATAFIKAYPTFNLEDKIVFDEQGNVTGIKDGMAFTQEEPNQPIRKSSRISKWPKKLKEFVT
ncbi:hypothetical protein QQ045_029663 [Rhodiola kirilowii]